MTCKQEALPQATAHLVKAAFIPFIDRRLT